MEYCNRNKPLIKRKSDLISKQKPDIIFIQESNISGIKLDNYLYIKFPHLAKTELMDIYLRKDCNWLKDSIQEITTSLCFTPRSCKIITLKHKTTNQKIKIANIHLCGGRYDENDKIGGMLKGSLKDVRKRKNEIIEILVKTHNVDIVAGDFNSDLICYLNNGTLQNGHLSFFKKIAPKKTYKIYQE